MPKEMVGGCCVCSDERGWNENPLVYCDGPNCPVAVHQACYGIVAVPKDDWYCQKCESHERATRVKCELCPSKDGAFKKTDTNGWAHVVCALYIPEVRFGNVTTMEPIVLSLIPPERFNRTCYLCQEQGKGNKSNNGACMQCNKSGCKQQFHVTCAQALGLLCEEAGNYMDNVKYCGYCTYHYAKIKKGPNLKTVPPFKPLATGEHDSSPEKDNEVRAAAKRKSFVVLKPIGPPSGKTIDESTLEQCSEEAGEEDGEVTLKFGTTTSHAPDANKFTTSNFVETVVTQSDPVFGSDAKPDGADASGKNKKRKGSVSGKSVSDTSGDSSISSSRTPVSTITSTAQPIKSMSLSLTSSKGTTVPGNKSSPGGSGLSAPPPPKTNLAVYGTGTKITISVPRDDQKKLKAEPGSSSAVTSDKNTDSPFSSAPLTDGPLDTLPGKRSRSSSAEKTRKTKRTPNKRAPAPGQIKDEVESPPGSPEISRSVMRRKPQVKEEKDTKIIQPLSAPHMLGNQLNPASSMAQKMNDSLHQEVEAHSVYSHEAPTSNIVGPVFPRARASSVNNDKTLSAANSLLSLGNPGAVNNVLESFLERQWNMGGHVMMEQAQHFDIASLLSCLHQLKEDNMKLEEKLQTMTARRDHLLAVNARLNTPLSLTTPPTVSIQEVQETVPVPASRPQPVRMENGIGHGPDGHNYVQTLHNRGQPQPSPTIRPPSMASVYAANQQARRPVVSSYQSYPPQQMSNASNPSMGVRRDDMHQQM